MAFSGSTVVSVSMWMLTNEDEHCIPGVPPQTSLILIHQHLVRSLRTFPGSDGTYTGSVRRHCHFCDVDLLFSGISIRYEVKIISFLLSP